MPTGQVFRWQTRIRMQPSATSGAVAKPNSSAPSRAAITTSRPVLSPPSVCTRIRPRRSFLHQRLLGLRQADLPGRAGVLDRGERRSARPAVVTADQHAVRLALGHARRDRADPALRHQLHADVRPPVRVLQVVDQLGQVLDRVDVVVRRRRDQPDARRRVAGLGDRLVDLVAGQLPAFARLRALRDLDLQLVRVDQVPAGHAEAPRRHLLDRAALRVAAGQRA